MKIGTRSSAMALAQTEEVARLLRLADVSNAPEICAMKPSGDIDQVSRLDRHGGKGGAFVMDIRASMTIGDLDCAMHSLKDMPGNEETPGFVIGAFLKREAPEDALVLRPGLQLDDVLETKAAGLRIGTNAVRRSAYLQRLFPDAEIIHFRGAADTRLRKLDEGIPQKLPDGGETPPADMLVCAKNGLERIGRGDRVAHTFSPEEILPAIRQGIVAVECHSGDWQTREKLKGIDDPETRAVALAEREVLWVLDGHCNSPMAGLAEVNQTDLRLKASVLSLDGSEIMEAEAEGSIDHPRTLGRKVALMLLSQGADRLVEASRV
ncbi:MAG: hydroxymethylbilane synthase [Pseudomonadota bacterium]